MCIFCDIIKKNIGADLVYENNELIAISDIHPKTPVHILIIPKKHVESIKNLEEVDKEMIYEIFKAARKIAEQKGLAGYKLIFNVGKEGGQIINHLHLHLLGGWDNKSQSATDEI